MSQGVKIALVKIARDAGKLTRPCVCVPRSRHGFQRTFGLTTRNMLFALAEAPEIGHLWNSVQTVGGHRNVHAIGFLCSLSAPMVSPNTQMP